VILLDILHIYDKNKVSKNQLGWNNWYKENIVNFQKRYVVAYGSLYNFLKKNYVFFLPINSFYYSVHKKYSY